MHQGEFVQAPCCPLWGKCRDSGKGGVVSNFEMLPFNEQHPLSQPVRAASSPIGEPRATAQPPLKGEDGATAPEGFPAVRRIPFEMHQGEFVPAPLLPPLGEVPRSGKGGAVGIFELLPFNEPHPLSQAVRPASSPIGEPRGPPNRPFQGRIELALFNEPLYPVGLRAGHLLCNKILSMY